MSGEGQSFAFVTVSPSGRVGKPYNLHPNVYRLGRYHSARCLVPRGRKLRGHSCSDAECCDIVFKTRGLVEPYPGVLPLHALLFVRPNEVFVMAVEDKAEVMVNGGLILKPMVSAPLQTGQVVSLSCAMKKGGREGLRRKRAQFKIVETLVIES